MANDKRQFVPSDQVLPLLFIYYSLRLHWNQKIHASFIYKNCFKQFVFANVLSYQIVDFNMAFVLKVILNLSIISDKLPLLRMVASKSSHSAGPKSANRLKGSWYTFSGREATSLSSCSSKLGPTPRTYTCIPLSFNGWAAVARGVYLPGKLDCALAVITKRICDKIKETVNDKRVSCNERYGRV